VTVLSRRNFLKLSAFAALGLAFDLAQPSPDTFHSLGRVTTEYLRVHLRPSKKAKQVAWLGFDNIIKIFDSLLGDEGRVWHEVSNGYVESVEVQPVENRLNPVGVSLPSGGQIGEITVPFTDARRKPEAYAPIIYRLYYGSTFWVRDLMRDSGGQVWYKLYDERLGIYYYALAAHLRLVPANETTPLSPSVTGKRLVVNLQQQRLYAYEGSVEVFSTLISAGRLYLAGDGLTTHSWTPPGQFTIERKRPTRHMGFGEASGSDYELPGVPWVSYFHWKGFSFHGTWWHNDFGRPRSAGCINMLPEDARWLYRWSHPIPLPDQELTTGAGTAVEIIDG